MTEIFWAWLIVVYLLGAACGMAAAYFLAHRRRPIDITKLESTAREYLQK